MKFNSAKELQEYADTVYRAAEPTRRFLALEHSLGILYFLRRQWRSNRGHPVLADGSDRILINHQNRNDGKIRVTQDRLSKFVRQTIASTHPVKMDTQWNPQMREPSPSSIEQAAVLEELAAAMTEWSGMTRAAQEANLRRRVGGQYLLGFQRVMSGEGDYCYKSFFADPFNLILDPGVQDPDLRGHDTVTYEEIWSESKLRRVFGGGFLRDKELKPIGQLAPMQLAAYNYTGGAMYSRFMRDSKKLGARVLFVFNRQPGAVRYEQMHTLVDFGTTQGEGDIKAYKFDEAENPYGDDGLPMVLLHAHRRPDGMWSDGDVALLRTDQDLLNLIASYNTRLLANSAGWRMMVDRRFFGSKITDDQIRQYFSNQAHQIVIGAGARDKSVMEPRLMASPATQTGTMEQADRIENSMRSAVHRAMGHEGQAKSHVPDATNQRIMDAAELVLDTQVQHDTVQYAKLVRVLTATAVADLVNEKPASVIGAAARYGVTESDISLIRDVDPNNLPGECKIRESSVRLRSARARRADIDFAVQLQAISPAEYRSILANELDTPIGDSDRQAVDFAQRVANRITSDPSFAFAPVPLGPVHGEIVVTTLQRAAMSRAASRDPQVQARLSEAVQAQARANAEFVMSTSPEAIMQQQQAEQEAAVQQEQAARELAAETDPTLSEVLGPAPSGPF